MSEPATSRSALERGIGFARARASSSKNWLTPLGSQTDPSGAVNTPPKLA
jgi:hypothetical protein